ncbi:MAG: tetratricopeptide repeat protein [bacterium]
MSPRTERILLGLLLAVAAVQRLAYFLAVRTTDLVNVPLLDCRTYHEWALRLVGGDWGWYETYWMGPLYPHLLAGLYAVAGVRILVPVGLQLALTVVNVLLVHRLARALAPPEGGRFSALVPLASAAVYAFYGPPVFYAGLLLMATLLTTLVLLLALQAVRAVERPTCRRWFVLGALVGVAALGRGNVLLLLVLLPVLLWRIAPLDTVRWKPAASLLLGAALVIAPVTLRNVLVAHDLVLLTSNGGLNLLIGQQTEHRGIFAQVSPEAEAEFDPSRELALEAELGRELKGSEISAILAARAWDRFREDLAAMPLHYLRKAYRFWNGYELPQIESFDFWRNRITALKLMPVPFVLIAALGLPGLFAAPRRMRWILGVIIAGYFLSLLPFFPTARYRLPIVPLLVIAGVALAAGLLDRRLDRRIWGPACLAALVLLWPGWARFSDAEVAWQVHLHEASRAARRGDLRKTLTEGRLAEQARPGLADTPFHLALRLEEMGAHEEALASLDLAAARAPRNRLIPYRRGRVLEEAGDVEGAVGAYTRAAVLDPEWFHPWLRAGLLLRRSGHQDDALTALEIAHGLAPGERRVRVNLASLLAERGDLDRARAILEALIRDDPHYVNGWFNLALVEANSGQKDAARIHLERAAGLRNLTDSEREQIRQLDRALTGAGN